MWVLYGVKAGNHGSTLDVLAGTITVARHRNGVYRRLG